MTSPLYCLGAASGLAGRDLEAGRGPEVLRDSPEFSLLEARGLCHWVDTVHIDATVPPENRLKEIQEFSLRLANKVHTLARRGERFAVIGGDHACAIGTWSGARAALGPDLGLLWIDAHLDSHTHETTPSGNIHGMPVATLLGKGDPGLASVLLPDPKINPEAMVLVGIRSFEPEEQALLNSLGVRVYYMGEVKERGLAPVLREAMAHIRKNSRYHGMTIDLDGFDPRDAPAVSTPEAGGLSFQEFQLCLPELVQSDAFCGIEIAEFNPRFDLDRQTVRLMIDVLTKTAGG